MGSPGTAELNRFLVKWENSSYQFYLALAKFTIFLYFFFWFFLNYKLAISHNFLNIPQRYIGKNNRSVNFGNLFTVNILKHFKYLPDE